jgi:hypothetical protein
LCRALRDDPHCDCGHGADTPEMRPLLERDNIFILLARPERGAGDPRKSRFFLQN